jgi:hypothetical protein
MKTEKQIKLIISQRRNRIKEISSWIEEMKTENPKRCTELSELILVIEDEISLLKWVLK